MRRGKRGWNKRRLRTETLVCMIESLAGRLSLMSPATEGRPVTSQVTICLPALAHRSGLQLLLAADQREAGCSSSHNPCVCCVHLEAAGGGGGGGGPTSFLPYNLPFTVQPFEPWGLESMERWIYTINVDKTSKKGQLVG